MSCGMKEDQQEKIVKAGSFLALKLTNECHREVHDMGRMEGTLTVCFMSNIIPWMNNKLDVQKVRFPYLMAVLRNGNVKDKAIQLKWNEEPCFHFVVACARRSEAPCGKAFFYAILAQ